LFIDASKEFVRSGIKNKISESNRRRILDAYIKRANDMHFAKLVPNSDVANNNYDIPVSNYIESEELSEDIDITKLNAEISTIVTKQNCLRQEIDKIITDIESGK
jgi:type I restriction enzyme M protein